MQKHVVILGAGFGGIATAHALARACMSGAIKVTIIDRSRFHVFTPLLYEAATGFVEHENLGTAKLLESGVNLDIASLVAPWGADFLCDEVTGHDAAAREVTLASGARVPYDKLVVALGAEINFFGIPGLKENAVVLKNVHDADRLRQRVHDVLHMKEMGKHRMLRVIIGGGGATGVELAAELTMFLRRHVMKGHLLPTEFDITLVEASPRLIGAMPVEVSHGARERLRSLGIRVHLDSTIKEVRMGGVTLAPRTCKPGETPDQLLCDFTSEGERRMESDLVIWCGGIRGSSSLEPLGFTLDARGKRIEVPASLEVPGLSGVYAIGDSALCMNPATKMPVPWLAQAAMAMGRTVAARIAAEIGSDASTAENAALPVYAFPVFPVVVPLGGKYCAAVAFGRTFMGFSGWCIHELATLRYFITVMPMLRGIAYWWRGARMYAVND